MEAHISTEMINYTEVLMFNLKYRDWVRQLFLKKIVNFHHEEDMFRNNYKCCCFLTCKANSLRKVCWNLRARLACTDLQLDLLLQHSSSFELAPHYSCVLVYSFVSVLYTQCAYLTQDLWENTHTLAGSTVDLPPRHWTRRFLPRSNLPFSICSRCRRVE